MINLKDAVTEAAIQKKNPLNDGAKKSLVNVTSSAVPKRSLMAVGSTPAPKRSLINTRQPVVPIQPEDHIALSMISQPRYGSEDKRGRRGSIKTTLIQENERRSSQDMYQDQEMTETEMAIKEAKLRFYKEAQLFFELESEPASIEAMDAEWAEKRRRRLSLNQHELRKVMEAEGDRLKRMITPESLKKRDDWKDLSIHPSYTDFKVPYHLTCRERYAKMQNAYEHQFQYEISQIMKQHSYAYEVARVVRHLAITTLWPPLHSRREVEETTRLYFRLKRKHRERLNVIMSTNII